MKSIDKAIDFLKNGNVIAIPTETVYGLAANAFDEEAVKMIFEIKNRPSKNPLIVHIAHKNQLKYFTKNIPHNAKILASNFWPGPLTLLLPKKKNISDIITSGSKLVAVRVPNHKLTLKLLSKIDFPLVAPSANLFQSISPTTAKHVKKQLKNKIPFILNGGICKRGVESTIIGFHGNKPILYRYGAIAVEEIEKIVGKVEIYDAIKTETKLTPGLYKKHYSPKTKLLFTNNVISIQNKFKNTNAIVLSLKGINKLQLPQVKLSKSGNLRLAAHKLFDTLYKLDEKGYDLIIVEEFPQKGLGKTINDRLKRAAYKIKVSIDYSLI